MSDAVAKNDSKSQHGETSAMMSHGRQHERMIVGMFEYQSSFRLRSVERSEYNDDFGDA
jgi:hypothetical protein